MRFTSKRSRIALGFSCCGALWLSLLACASEPTLTPPGPPSAFPPGCGMTLFSEPECERQADAQCCAQQDQCTRDPECARVAKCWVACDAQAKAMKKAGQEGACGCFTNCFPQGAATPGMGAFSHLTGCLQSGGPRGVSCGSQC